MLKKLLLAAALFATGSTAALAHDGWGHERWDRGFHRGHFIAVPRPVYVVPAPRVVYAPPPPVVYPYYAAPVVVRPAPVVPVAPAISFRINLPL